MDWGPFVATLERMERKGRCIPALERRVDPYDDLLPVWNIFNGLHKSRMVSFAIEALNITDILNYLKLLEYKGDDKIETFNLIKAMDSCWLNWYRERDKERDKDKKRKKK